MAIKIITISRQFGTGGHTIGKTVAKKLGIPFYDNELVTKIAEKSGFDVTFVKENSEKTFSPTGLFYEMGIHGSFSSAMPLSLYDQLYIAQHNIIREIAEKESCVIVGRCADYVLEDRDDVMNVFIYADNEYRGERILRIYGDNGQKMERRIKDKDNRRASYYRHYTNREFGDVHNYSLCIDSSCLTINDAADLIITFSQKHV